MNVGHALMELGAFEQAIAVMKEWCAHAEKAGLPGVVARATQNIGRAQLQTAKEKMLACRVPAELRAGYLAKPEHARILELTDLTIRS